MKLELPLDGLLNISGVGEDTGAPAYKGRATFRGKLVFGSDVFDDIIFVVDQSKTDDELVTFWRSNQRGDSGGSKVGAHPFAEAYMGYLMGKTIESQSFPPSKIVQISDEYNSDPKFNITAWIIKSAQPLREEPINSRAPIEPPTGSSCTVLVMGDGSQRHMKTSTFDPDGSITTKAKSLVGSRIRTTCWDPKGSPGRWSSQGYFRNIYAAE
jgi:hypothetical protein